MLEKIKLFFLRKTVQIIVPWKWRGKSETALVAKDKKIGVDGGEITIRVYTPDGAGRHPLMLFFHGGGWVGFDINTHDALCRALCVGAQHIVASVDYRLAPEHPFPTGINDSLHALDWLIDNAESLGGDNDRLVVCGDSAGGNIAAVIAQQARQRHPGRIKAQLLIYPVTDHTSRDWPSYRIKGGSDAELSHETMSQLWQWYTRDSDLWREGQVEHELATPLRVANLDGLPDSFVILAENDLLHDEGQAYADRLADSGVSVTTKLYPGQQHGFVGLQPSDANREAISDMCQWLNALWGRYAA